MPCAYAHYRLGQEVLVSLPREARERVLNFKEFYDIGLHGPDILFYHNPLPMDGISKLGHDIHKLSGEEVFGAALEVLRERRDAPMYLSYVYGYLCHFALDVMCHGYVAEFMASSGLSHNEIEMEFDRYLTLIDGHDPLKFDTAAHIVPSRRNSAVIASFYPGVETRDIQRSLRSMIICLHTLIAPKKSTRAALRAAFRVSGHSRELDGLIMSRKPNPACQESSRRLSELYKLAVPLSIKLISELPRVEEGKQEFDRHLKMNFSSIVPTPAPDRSAK